MFFEVKPMLEIVIFAYGAFHGGTLRSKREKKRPN
jgi:hypothetical protein